MVHVGKAAVFTALVGAAHGLLSHKKSDASVESVDFAWRRSNSSAPDPDDYGETSGECECLNWKHVYSRGAIPCGSGREHEHKVIDGDVPFWVPQFFSVTEVCHNFFLRIDDNVCVNRLQDRYTHHMRPQQWCYVLAECTGPGTTETLDAGNTRVRIKWCDPKHGDSMLWDYTPEELFRFAADHDLDPAQLSKFAYRVEREATWENAKGGWGQTSTVALAKTSTRMQKLVNYIKDIDQYVVLDSDDRHPPFGIVKGSKAWQIMPDPNPDRRSTIPPTKEPAFNPTGSTSIPDWGEPRSPDRPSKHPSKPPLKDSTISPTKEPAFNRTGSPAPTDSPAGSLDFIKLSLQDNEDPIDAKTLFDGAVGGEIVTCVSSFF